MTPCRAAIGQKETAKVWAMILDFLERAQNGAFPSDRMVWKFESDAAVAIIAQKCACVDRGGGEADELTGLPSIKLVILNGVELPYPTDGCVSGLKYRQGPVDFVVQVNNPTGGRYAKIDLEQSWLCGAAAGLALQGAAAQTISVGEVSAGVKANTLADLYRDHKGFFSRRLRRPRLRTRLLPESANVVQQAVAGSLDIAVSGPGDALRAINQGAPLTLLRVEVGPSGYEIFAKKSIKTVADLRGKLIMIGGAKDITRYYIEALLRHGGVKPGDYDYIYAGATSQRYAALVSGSIDATILTAPFNFTARSGKYTDFGPPRDRAGSFRCFHSASRVGAAARGGDKNVFGWLPARRRLLLRPEKRRRGDRRSAEGLKRTSCRRRKDLQLLPRHKDVRSHWPNYSG